MLLGSKMGRNLDPLALKEAVDKGSVPAHSSVGQQCWPQLRSLQTCRHVGVKSGQVIKFQVSKLTCLQASVSVYAVLGVSSARAFPNWDSVARGS